MSMDEEWRKLVKATTARFARNISARNGRILLPEEQARERVKARRIAERWRDRAVPSDEAATFCERVYREVGVTAALRRAYEFYRRTLGNDAPSGG